jgi:hypothetical protein
MTVLVRLLLATFEAVCPRPSAVLYPRHRFAEPTVASSVLPPTRRALRAPMACDRPTPAASRPAEGLALEAKRVPSAIGQAKQEAVQEAQSAP